MVAAMSRPHPSLFVFLLSLPLALAACPDDGSGRSTPDTGDTADTEPDAEVEGDTSPDTSDTDSDTAGDTPDTAGDTQSDTDPDVEPGPPLEVSRLGARMIGAPIQLSVTDTGHGRFLWVGTRANLVPVPGDSTRGELRGGLFRYDLTTGAAVRFEDELPREDYSEFMALDPLSFGPAPTAAVQADGDRFVVVARTGLLGLDGQSSEPSFTQVVVEHEGAPLVPVQLAIARDGLRPVAWMTSDKGLVRLDEDTFTVEAVIRGVDLAIEGDTGGDFGRLTVDPDTGAVYAGYYTSDGRSALVKVGVDNQRRVWLTGDGGPRGRVGELVFSKAAGKVYAALASWSAAEGGVVAWDGELVTSIVREGPLAEAHSGESGPFGAHSLALDAVHGVLAVGGQVQSGLGGLKGGGLVLIELGAEGAPRLRGLDSRDAPLIHWHVQSLVWDTAGRELFMVASDLCNETRLRALGVFGVRFVDGRVVYRRPFVSSIRSLAEVGRDGESEVLAGVRDDNGGLACESVPVLSGLGRLEAGGLQLLPVVSVAGDGISQNPGVTAMHAEGGLTLGTWRDGFLVGQKAGDRVEGFVGNPALIGPSLFLDAVWARDTERGGREVWLAGRTSHQPGDPVVVADRGPRGVAMLEIANGALASSTHYVRSSEDGSDVVGLPSGDIRDLAANAAGDLVLSCAKERMAPNYDRDESPVFLLDGQSRGGGLALIPSADRSVVSVLADHSVTPDPRAVAFAPDGHLWVADAERGVLRSTAPIGTRDGAGEADAFPREPPAPFGFEPVALAGWPTGASPIRLWVGEGSGGATNLAVATTMGLWVRLGGRELVVDGVGYVWSLLARDGALWAGTDEGLVVVAPEGQSGPSVTLPAPAPGEAVPWP
jgi:hypothetical protein